MLFRSVLGSTTEVSPVQPLKAPAPISLTDSGILIDLKPVQPTNVLSLIDVTDEGMSMDCNDVQYPNPPRLRTDFGIFIEVKFEHPLNPPSTSTEPGMWTFLSPVQFLKVPRICVNVSGSETEVNPVQS